MNKLFRIGFQLLALTVVFMVLAACGGLDEAEDLGLNPTPTSAVLVVYNQSNSVRLVYVSYTVRNSDDPSLSGPDMVSGEETTHPALKAVTLHPGEAKEVAAPVYSSRIVRFFIESWEPDSGGDRRTHEVAMPGRVPQMTCSAKLSGSGEWTHECQ